MKFRLASLVHDSIVDGPGLRIAVFVQGCSHKCSGCHNPQTHDPAGGTETDTADIISAISSNPLIYGITLTGGEPFEQAPAMLDIARAAKGMGLNVIAYTGYTIEALLAQNNDDIKEFISFCDWVVDGPFILSKRTLSLPWRGSENQRLLSGPESIAAGYAVNISGGTL